MFNYGNLSDNEFESLCLDIMSLKLGKQLRRFPMGRDGGIDLIDSKMTGDVVVQVKHYNKSPFSTLKSSLLKEVAKLKIMDPKPKQYYLCCSQGLTPQNIQEIYRIFEDYMDSPENVVTIQDIDRFLVDIKNVEILNRHYKLWLESTGVLSLMYNQDILIDSEDLLESAKENLRLFVKTKVYDECLKVLDNHHMLIIIGSPGVGKTMNSKMLALHHNAHGYKLNYTTGSDVSSIKRAISKNPEIKEIILLDDCFGQNYFTMKENQSRELLSLIKYIKRNKNKRLILNSRVTIYNESKERDVELNSYLVGQNGCTYIIDMDKTSELEKAEILYNHLVLNELSLERYTCIKTNKRYLEIVNHRNYTPRIIEYFTKIEYFEKSKFTDYYEFILNSLNFPMKIWENEYKERLKKEDRIFLLTLYSLSDNRVDFEVMKKAYSKQILISTDIDQTFDQFESVLKRLSESMVMIVDHKSKQYIQVINPSVNDYIKTQYKQFFASIPLSGFITYSQLERIYDDEILKNNIKQFIKTSAFIDLIYASQDAKSHVITSWICKLELKELSDDYVEIVRDFFLSNFFNSVYSKNILKNHEILEWFLYSDLGRKLNISEYLYKKSTFERLMYNLSLEEYSDILKVVHVFYIENGFPIWIDDVVMNLIEDAIQEYSSNYEELSDLTYQLFNDDNQLDDYELNDIIKQIVEDDVREIIKKIPIPFIKNVKVSENITIDRYAIQDIIQNMSALDSDAYNYEAHGSIQEISGIDYIFEREWKF